METSFRETIAPKNTADAPGSRVGIRVAARLLHQDPPEPGAGVRVALYQGQSAEPVGTTQAVEANLDRLDEVIEMAARYQCHVCAFPEKYTTGYSTTVEQEKTLGETHDGPSENRVRLAAKRHKMGIILPYAERDGDKMYDTIMVIGPNGEELASHRKIHLYGAAERNNYTPGDTMPPVFDLNGVRSGVLNCYECEFPTLYQHLAEQGAHLVIGPTAADSHFPLADGTVSLVPYQDATKHIIPAMASIWRMFVAYANRRGWEHTPRGSWQFKGNSGIWAPTGEALVAAGPDERTDDALLIADCVPDAQTPFSPEGNHARDNRVGLAPGLRPPK